MQLVNVYKRLTHKFSPGWSNLDDWEFQGTLKLTPRRQVREGNGHDDGGSFVQYARRPAGVPFKQVADGLRAMLGYSGCRHEYDCCGCRHEWVRVKRVGRRQVQVRTTVGFNY